MNPPTRAECLFVSKLDQMARSDRKIQGAFVKSAADSAGIGWMRAFAILCELRNLQQLSLLKDGILMRKPRRF